MVAYQYVIPTAKFYKTLRAAILLFAVKHNMYQLNNLWFDLWFLKQGTPSNACQKPLYLYSKICEKKG